MDLFKKISPHSTEWRALKEELLTLRNTRVGQLIGSETTHDRSNQLRGAIQLIDMLLYAEEAAIKAAYEGRQ